MLNEADTCRKFVMPKLLAAGWDTEPHSIAEQRTIAGAELCRLARALFDTAKAR